MHCALSITQFPGSAQLIKIRRGYYNLKDKRKLSHHLMLFRWENHISFK